jgi:integrase
MARKSEGIRKVGNAYEAYGKVGGVQFSRRFPLETPMHMVRTWRRERLNTLRQARPGKAFGGFSADVAKFLNSENGRRKTDFEDLLLHWVGVFNTKPRVLITAAEIQVALDAWKGQGVAASTLNHRRQALLTLFKRLDPEAPNPVKKTTKYREPSPEPRAVPDHDAERIFEAMPDCVTKARLLCIYNSGLRHSELARVRAEDISLDGTPSIFVRSGKGGNNRIVPLNFPAMGAYMMLEHFKGWGEFSRDSVRKTFRLACKKAGIPVGKYRPYDLRHRFATRVREYGADLADVQELLGHRDPRTTRRYAPVVQRKLVNAVNALVAEV